MPSRTFFHAVMIGFVVGSLLAVSAAANASQALATSKSCMACHGLDNKLVGPSFREVAAKYQGRADGVAVLIEKINKGSTGAWGAIPMPPQGQLVNAAEANALATWIMSLR